MKYCSSVPGDVAIQSCTTLCFSLAWSPLRVETQIKQLKYAPLHSVRIRSLRQNHSTCRSPVRIRIYNRHLTMAEVDPNVWLIHLQPHSSLVEYLFIRQDAINYKIRNTTADCTLPIFTLCVSFCRAYFSFFKGIDK